MPFHRSTLLPLLCALLLSLTVPLAANATDAKTEAARARFVQAEQALAAGQRERFATLRQTLGDYPLAPDLDIAALLTRLAQAQAAEVEALIEAQGGSAPGERLRRLWLARLAREERWAEFARLYIDNGSNIRECLYRQALLNTGEEAAAAAGIAALYLTGNSLPDACDPLFQALAKSGGLPPDLVWQRIEEALFRNNPDVARYQGRYLPASEGPWIDFRLAAATAASRFPAVPKGQHPRRALAIGGALADFARRQPDKALELLGQRFASLPKEQAGLVRASAGLTLAERGERARALKELDQLVPGTGTLRLQQQRLRAGLRAGAWSLIPRWIEALPREEREQAQWQYWTARALEQQALAGPTPAPTPPEAALAIYRQVATERNLWGFLAAERLGLPPHIGHQPTPVSPQRRAALLASTRAVRLRELQALARPLELTRELRDYRHLINHRLKGEARNAALREDAVLAQALGHRIEAIMTLAQSGYWDDLELRFPLLYTDLIKEHAKANGLPPEWVLAVIRQESLFIPDASSSASAIGLMQLLPGTAREVAARIGIPAPSREDLTKPALNIRLGSAYLASLQRRFGGHTAAATAAYNAGPNAVRRWIPDQPMDADVWIAAIPFYETRAYVARILAYRMLYAYRLDEPLPSLKEMLPPVGGS